MPDWARISQHISEATGERFAGEEIRSVGGGCINSAYVLSDGSQRLFVKLNRASRLGMFEAEAEGLNEIGRSQSIRIPQPLCWGLAGNDAFLVLEYLDLSGHGAAAQMGRELAQMHRHSQARFGWHRGNTIGSTPQPNDYTDQWPAFWQQQRLGYQLYLAEQAGARLGKQGEQLLARVPEFFSDYQPQASLLHGDLWSGNAAVSADGSPVIFDPASYYGDRETDLAMTELFGGFSSDFYAAYNEAWPLDPGYKVRKTLYNLYHILNHYNLFGGGYLAQAQGMIDRLLSELR